MSSPPVLPDPPRRFGAAVWHATAPLLLWALHFFALYVVVAAGCMRGWGDAAWRGMPLVNVALFGLSAAVLVPLMLMLWRALHDRRHSRDRGQVVPVLRLGGCVLALVGVVWDTVPLLMLPPCT